MKNFGAYGNMEEITPQQLLEKIMTAVEGDFNAKMKVYSKQLTIMFENGQWFHVKAVEFTAQRKKKK